MDLDATGARILVTGSIPQSVALNAIHANVAHYVFIKPWDRGAILKAVQTILSVAALDDDLVPAQSEVRSASRRIIYPVGEGKLGQGRYFFSGRGRGTRPWHRWLNRRSQHRRLNWERFQDFLKTFPLPRPTIRVRIWAVAPRACSVEEPYRCSSPSTAPRGRGGQLPGATRPRTN